MSTPILKPAWNPEAVERFADVVGGSVHDDAWGPSIDVGSASIPTEGSAVAPLSDLGVLAVSGPDGAAFLHAQLTNDVEHLDPGVARWGGYCTAKGRLLSTFRYWRGTDAVLMAVSRPLAASLARRLSMFVLRAKARVAEVSDDHVAFGLLGQAAGEAAAAALGLRVPDADGVSQAVEGAQLVGLPPMPEGGRPRWLLVLPAAQAATAWEALRTMALPMSGAAWRRTEVLAGVPRIVADTAELFVPQMLNFESVDGVNFRKGCYPGQEIVARSQYLGKLKRRMFSAQGVGTVPAPAADVVPSTGGEPCGQVVLAAPDGTGGFDVLFESQTAAVEVGPVAVDGVTLSIRALPYPLKAID